MGTNKKGRELGKGISQRKDGSYMGRYVDCYGKRKAIYDRDLKALRKRLEKEILESKRVFGLEGSSMTLNEWFEKFLVLYKEKRVKSTTLHRIHQTYAPCKADVLGTIELKDVRAVQVQKLINKLEDEGFAYGTLRLLKSLLNEMFKTAVGNGYMLINPCEAVVLPKKPKNEQRYLSVNEQEMFLDVAKEYQHYDIFCTCLGSGMRIGEVLGLKWDDVDFEHKVINISRTLHYSPLKEKEQCHFHFTTPKTENSERTIPLLPETEKVLRRVKARQSRNRLLAGAKWKQEPGFENMIFTSQHGSPVRHGDVNRTIKQVVVKANLQEQEIAKFEGREAQIMESFAPHCFRHTFITRCSEHGVPYEIIKVFVGHSSIKTTMGYNHYKEEIDMSELNKISFLNVV